MLVTDLRHFLDLPPDTPGPARALAGHLGDVVRAATAGDAGTAWQSALPCRRRPARQRCAGRMIVLRTAPGDPIRWRCSVCDDEGVVSNWEDSPFDLRRRRPALAGPVSQIVISGEVAAALRELRLPDADCERLVFGIGAGGAVAILAATEGGPGRADRVRGGRSQPRARQAPTAAARRRIRRAHHSRDPALVINGRGRGGRGHVIRT
jgi:hypothetical protein